MHQFGLGIPQDFALAKKLYTRSMELDPSTTSAPVQIILNVLWAQEWLLEWPDKRARLQADHRYYLKGRVHGGKLSR